MSASVQSSTLRHYPLGQSMPDSPHAVCVSLPTMADVIGYEEKNPATVEAMTAGYPRFKLPEYVERLTKLIAKKLVMEPRNVLLLNSEKAAGDLLNYLDEPAAKVESEDDYAFVHFPAEPDAYARAFKFLQHTGCGISSRQAEDILIAQGHIETSFQEDLYEGDAEAEVIAKLAEVSGVEAEDILLTNSGMNAFYAAFLAAREINALLEERSGFNWAGSIWTPVKFCKSF